MGKRIAAIVFPHLMADWTLRRQPELKALPFVLVQTERGRRVIKAMNHLAKEKGVQLEMTAADCKTFVPDLLLLEYDPEKTKKVITAIAEWCIRYTPFVAVDQNDGLMLDVSGCTHLFGGEKKYLEHITERMQAFGYSVRTAMAGSIGTAWAVCRFGKNGTIIPSGKETEALSPLPPEALRLDPLITERLHKFGLTTIGSFMHMPSLALRRRFGVTLLRQLARALAKQNEMLDPVRPIPPYEERLQSMEPICTATGIGIAIKTLLEELCLRLLRESKGLRTCELKCYRVDGNVQSISIGTNSPSRNVKHLYKLFEDKISQIRPDLGIELFMLEAAVVEELQSTQDALWTVSSGNAVMIAELMDKLAGKIGASSIARYLPDEHYWPERSIKKTTSLSEKTTAIWRDDLPRPLHLLPRPEPIEVSVPIPDYPPLLFTHKGVLHTVKKADGPERIEQEWWIAQSVYRDYYCIEDEKGSRYWLFRSGDYASGKAKWFLHGFFA